MMSMIDVVIPTCNDDIRLNLTLWGLTQQSFKDFAVHVVNDGGNTKTKKLVLSYKDRLDIDYTYLKPSDIKYRPSYARNAGIKLSKSNRIIFIDCDTIPSNTMVEKHYESIDNDDIIVGPRKFIDENDVKWLDYKLRLNVLTYDDILNARIWEDERICVPEFNDKFMNLSLKTWDTYPYANMITNYKMCHSCQISYNTTVVKSIGGFCQSYDGVRFGEDHDLALRAIRYGCMVVTIPNVHVYHLGHQPRAVENSEFISDLLSKSRINTDLIRNGGPIL